MRVCVHFSNLRRVFSLQPQNHLSTLQGIGGWKKVRLVESKTPPRMNHITGQSLQGHASEAEVRGELTPAP